VIAQVLVKETAAKHVRHLAIWSAGIIAQKLVRELVKKPVLEAVKANVQKLAQMIVQKHVQ